MLKCFYWSLRKFVKIYVASKVCENLWKFYGKELKHAYKYGPALNNLAARYKHQHSMTEHLDIFIVYKLVNNLGVE